MVSKKETKIKFENFLNKVRKFWIKVESSNGLLLFSALIVYVMCFLILWAIIPNFNLIEFLKSESFRFFSMFVVIPLFTLLANNIFKVRERIDKQIQIIEDDKKKDIRRVIKESEQIWSNLLKLSSEIRYYDKERRIEDIKLELDAFMVEMSKIKSSWEFYFKNLKNVDEDYLRFLYKPIYVLFSSSNTVVQLFHDNPLLFMETNVNQEDKNEIEKKVRNCQFALGIIQTTINNVYHKSILTILNNYIGMEYGDKKAKRDAEKEIRVYLGYLAWLYNKIKKIEKTNEVFSYLEDYKQLNCDNWDINNYLNCKESSNEIQSYFKLNENWLRENRNIDKINYKDIWDSPYFEKLEELYNKLGKRKRKYSISSPYSKRCLMDLANCLDFQDIKRNIFKRASWPSFKTYSNDMFSISYPSIWHNRDVDVNDDTKLENRPNNNDQKLDLLLHKNKSKICVEGCITFDKSVEDKNIKLIKDSSSLDPCREYKSYYKCEIPLSYDQNKYTLKLRVLDNYYGENKYLVDKTLDSFRLIENK